MTEKIKDSMETCRIIVHAFEEELLNQRRYNDAKEIEVALNDMLKAFRSINAWSEVMNELEEYEIAYKNNEVKPLTDNMYYWQTRRLGIRDAIDIINQKLAEIEERN